MKKSSENEMKDKNCNLVLEAGLRGQLKIEYKIVVHVVNVKANVSDTPLLDDDVVRCPCARLIRKVRPLTGSLQGPQYLVV